MKIFITGCAKSGTTLFNRLFYAFDIPVIDNEISLEEFVKVEGSAVGKRTIDSIMSYPISKGARVGQRYLIHHNDIKLIYIRRSWMEVSKGGRVSRERWDSCEKQSVDYSDLVSYECDYADFTDPSKVDDIQKEVAELFGLEIKHKWSTYPDFVPEDYKGPTHDNYSLRRLGEGY